MPELHVFQSMWAMQNAQGQLPVPLEVAVRNIREAGFDGLTDHFSERAAARRLAGLCAEAGLQIEAQAFPDSLEALKPALANAAEFGCHHLTVQADVRPRSLGEALALLEGWQRLAEDAGVPMLIETHRYRLTNDLHFTLDLLEHMPQLRLLADLSHYVVGREIPNPPAAADDAAISTVLRHSWGLHGRVASCEQVQLPLSFAQHQGWVALFMGWWRQAMALWLARPQHPHSLSFTCELGPPPYAITGPDGGDVSDRWEEALWLKGQVQALWAACVAQHARTAT
ncbi:TIM barrel protein [Pseudomonas sp. NPDC007930]|uniref:sugar phosphate isomerase/epimerase family protein n=1 Tax=Pseudomonas sp. NPDC007930 TaxID=3364417 RepID=UPI0036E62861